MRNCVYAFHADFRFHGTSVVKWKIRDLLTCCNRIAGIPPSCGAILHTASDPSLPSGWDLGCYLGEGDEVFWNTPCFGLLQGLSYFGSYDQLLAAGGNFGCWTSRGATSADIYNACADNYQHNVYLRECASCNFMAVCVRWPKTQATDDESTP